MISFAKLLGPYEYIHISSNQKLIVEHPSTI